MRRLLVLHDTYDLSASWLADRLAARGARVTLLAGAELGDLRLRWHHRLGGHGADFALGRVDGSTLAPARFDGVINRLHYLPLALLARIGGEDESYARSEFYALFLSWMSALPAPVLNAPTPQGLAGNWRHPSAWTALARTAGLPIVSWRQDCASDADLSWQIAPDPQELTAIVVDGAVIAPCPLPEPTRAGCVALARAAGCGLFGARLVPDPVAHGGWRFLGANLLPDLAVGGEPLVDAVEAALAA